MKWLPPVFSLLLGLLGGYFLFGSNESGDVTVEDGHAERGLVEQQSGLEGRGGKPVESELQVAAKKGLTEAWLLSLEGQDEFAQIGALHERIKSASGADFIQVFESLDKSDGHTLNWIVNHILGTKWAESDPQGMLAYIESQPSDRGRSIAHVLFGSWAKKDLSAAYAAAQELGDSRIRSSAMQTVIRTVALNQPQRGLEMAEAIDDYRIRSASIQSVVRVVADKQPQLAIEMMQAQEVTGNIRNTSYLYSQIFSKWADRDPSGARQAALAMPDSPMKVKALSGALQQWVSTDPMEALNWLDALPLDSSVYNSRKEVFRQILRQDFDLAKEFVEAESDSVARREILSNLYLSNLARNKSYEEIESVFDWVGTVATGSTYDQKVGDVVRGMAEADMDRAMDFMLQMRPGNARMSALGSIASIIAERDPEAALAFAQSLVYKDEKSRALSGLSRNIMKQGVGVASALIAGCADPLVQRRLAGRIVRDWTQYDRPAALIWVQSLSDDQARSSALGTVLNNWIQSESTEAINYMVAEFSEDRQLGSKMSSAYSQWAREDPEAAVAGLAKLPEEIGGSSANIFGRVAQSYVQHDPLAASEWISTLEEGPERDATVKTLVGSILNTDPEAGFIWSGTLTDESTRQKSLNRTVSEWVKTDPDAAYKAVKDANIEAVEKEPLFKLIEVQQQK